MPTCVLVHFIFHWILSVFEKNYHGQSGQPYSEQGPIVCTNDFSNS
jgi:hypothetical protein